MAQPNGVRESLFKMKTVSEMTGFSPTLLRAWERRYDFLEPDRLPGGHRLYSEEDLKVLKRVKELLDAGLSVGEVAARGRGSLLGESTEVWEDLLDETAAGLAPTDLQIFRSERFRGEGLGVSVRELSVEDLSTVGQLYETLRSVYELWLYMDAECRNEQLLRDHLYNLQRPEFVARLARLGSGKDDYPPLVRAALEDARWGAMGPLLRHLDQAKDSPDALRMSVLLARDQAKMLRNAFVDLDTSLRAADESHKAHGIRGMVEKVPQFAKNFEVKLDWEGSVSSRCLETSAVDRVLYDFLRRIEACQSTSSALWVGPINSRLTRWAFRFQGKGFKAHQEGDLATIAVAESAGVSPAGALELGYLGSAEEWAWFHWPVFEPAEDDAVCECEI